jgi:CRP-like cAMP-binding protein
MAQERSPECASCKAREKNIFCRLGAEGVRSISDAKSSRLYQKKQALFHEGNPVQGLYCVYSGGVKVFKTGLGGKQLILRMAYAGDVVALEDIFYSKQYTASAEMIEEGRVCLVDKAILIDAIRSSSTLALSVMGALSSEVIYSEDERVELAQNPVRERMARLLTVLSESHGTPSGKGVRIDLPVSREEMAEMIGTASETAMRLLKEFRDDHLLEVDGRKIHILDREKLRKAAGIVL